MFLAHFGIPHPCDTLYFVVIPNTQIHARSKVTGVNLSLHAYVYSLFCNFR